MSEGDGLLVVSLSEIRALDRDACDLGDCSDSESFSISGSSFPGGVTVVSLLLSSDSDFVFFTLELEPSLRSQANLPVFSLGDLLAFSSLSSLLFFSALLDLSGLPGLSGLSGSLPLSVLIWSVLLALDLSNFSTLPIFRGGIGGVVGSAFPSVLVLVEVAGCSLCLSLSIILLSTDFVC